VTYAFEYKNLYLVGNGRPSAELDVEGTLPADPPVEISVDVEEIVERESPMVWKEDSTSSGPFQNRVKPKLEPGPSSKSEPL
jgi:hypothetical protein